MGGRNDILLENGIRLAFRTIFDCYARSLVLFADRYLTCREESESIVQDVFILLWESDVRFKDELSVKSYLYITTRNKCLDILRHRKVEHSFLANSRSEEEVDPGYIKCLIEEETRRLIFSAIEALPEQCRKVCLLNLEGKDNTEIANLLNISLNTVKFHKKNAYKILREKLQQYFYLIFIYF